MGSSSFVKVVSISLLLVAMAFPTARAQQRATTGDLAGTAISEDGKPVAGATVQVVRSDGSSPQTATTDANGLFRVRGLAPGLYKVAARRIGLREARLPSLRIIAGQTTEVRVTLTASPTQLSTVEVRVTPTTIDATTTELTRKLTVADVALVPIGRDAASLVELVPEQARDSYGAAPATHPTITSSTACP